MRATCLKIAGTKFVSICDIIYDDADITVYVALLQMIRKQKWMSDDRVALFCTAAKGLSPFGILLSDEDVVSMNETMEALESATTTTASEYKLVTKILTKVPTDSWEFLLLLKTFTKPLVCAIWGSLPTLPAYAHNHQGVVFVQTQRLED